MDGKEISLWTADEAAGYLRLHVQTVYKLARDGELPSVKIGAARRFDPEAVKRWALDREAA